MTTCDWDIVIVGGGLAGLSMASELSVARFSDLKIALIEPRQHYVRDRTWSYWRSTPHPYADLERRQWNAWSVHHAGNEVRRTSSKPYCSIDADAFYRHAMHKITACAHIEVMPGQHAQAIAPGWPARVTLAAGTTLNAGLVVDARGSGANDQHSSDDLAQHFVGWEIETDVDVFDDQCVRLMDFSPAPAKGADGMHFLYLLPYNPRRALVESTWVSHPSKRVSYEAEIKSYLLANFGLTDYRVVFREQGSLGLTAKLTADDVPGVILVGRAAGALRASTGYAFLDTIQHCAQVTDGIAQCGGPLRERPQPARWHSFRRPALDVWMDEVFLRALRANWHKAPEYFFAMFERNQADTVTDFLSGRATLRDRLQLAASLPTLDFLRAAALGLRPQRA